MSEQLRHLYREEREESLHICGYNDSVFVYCFQLLLFCSLASLQPYLEFIFTSVSGSTSF